MTMTHADPGERRSNISARMTLLCAALSFAIACGPSARTVALQGLHAPTPRERTAAVRSLGQLERRDDDEIWVALERATRDPAAQVRIAAIESLAAAPRAGSRDPAERGALADDALSASLSDLDETVRIAAARVLGARCNERSIAYLHGAFARSGPPVRMAVAEALERCGVPREKQLAHEEQTRRARALERLGGAVSAWRAAGAHDLGLLGRPDDVAKLSPLLDDRDGAVVAAAADGLGLAAAKSAIPALQKLVGENVPLISSTAVEALGSFGGDALAGAQTALALRAQGDAEDAEFAAGALAAVAPAQTLCATALLARRPGAAALLAHGCSPAPFGEALVLLLKADKGTLPLRSITAERAAVLIEALAQTSAGGSDGTHVTKAALVSPAVELALGEVASRATGTLPVTASIVIEKLHASRAGPQLLAVVKRELAALENERAAHKSESDDHAAAARELAEAAMRAPTADREKIAKLMAMVRARQEKNGATPRQDAAARLKQLLAADVVVPSSHPLLASALRALISLDAKGATEIAAQLRSDPDRAVAMAARGESLPTAPSTAALSADCFPARDEASVADPDAAQKAVADSGIDWNAPARIALANSVVHPAPTRAARPGCLGQLLAQLPSVAVPPNATEAARVSLWSDDGGDRAAACTLLAQLHDGPSELLRATLTHDPERRVRDACAVPAAADAPTTR